MSTSLASLLNPRRLRLQARALSVLLAAYLCAGLILVAVVLANVFLDIPIGDLTRDPANTVGFPPYLGVLSYLGILLWCATATLCFFSCLALRGRDGWPGIGPLLLASGLLTSVLLADDLFLLHEGVFRRGIVYVTYAMALMVVVIAFHRTILQTDFLILVIGGGFLLLSMISDRLITERTSLKFLTEDGFKFLGIVGWFTYYARLSSIHVRKALDLRQASPIRSREDERPSSTALGTIADERHADALPIEVEQSHADPRGGEQRQREVANA